MAEFVCPEEATHGNPFRYCGVKGCGWMEDPTSSGYISRDAVEKALITEEAKWKDQGGGAWPVTSAINNLRTTLLGQG